MSDKNVKAVLINIRRKHPALRRAGAGSHRGAVMSWACLQPIVIRMEGTNVEEGKRLLKESG